MTYSIPGIKINATHTASMGFSMPTIDHTGFSVTTAELLYSTINLRVLVCYTIPGMRYSYRGPSPRKYESATRSRDEY